MEFDIKRVYTSVNADQVKVGSRVAVADNLNELRNAIRGNDASYTGVLKRVLDDMNTYRFKAIGTEWALCYLLEEPEEKKLKWTDLKIGDVIRNKYSLRECMIIEIEKKMSKEERMKEILKENPNFGKGVGYKMCVVDELHDIKELQKELKAEKEYSATLRKEIDEYTNSHTLCAKYKELEKACNETQELLDKQIEATYKLDKENAELKEEIKKWKDKWQEQVQKAIYAGDKRTQQTIQLTKAKKIIRNLLTLSMPIDYAKCLGPLQKIAEAEKFLGELD